MKGFPTTYLGLFDEPAGNRPAVSAIEIPIIQRDFAQGRPDDEATGIRERFLDAMCGAAASDQTMGLDFVYGDVRESVLRPLDGQQRLTTLFLLHWYVASRVGVLDASEPWLHFTYATRPTARDFCETISRNPYPATKLSPREWIEDQAWFVYPWRQDPTISSMLVMLDEIHDRLDVGHDGFESMWDRLSNRQDRVIWFLFLPVPDMDYGEDLYIKMNSRGKPLSPFEVFKADLEATLNSVLDPEQFTRLKKSMDGSWADLLWEYEKTGTNDYVIDDEFMRYLTFIVDCCEWRDGEADRRWRSPSKDRERSLEDRASLAFVDAKNVNAARNREFLFHAFDTWLETSPATEFSRLFTAGGIGEGPVPLLVSTSPDLFGSCITKYGSNEFSFAETLLLFAVLLARQPAPAIGDEDLTRRLRTLRNIAESAFLDRSRMSEYFATTEELILQGSLDDARAFQKEWFADEKLKWTLMEEHPESTRWLHLIEDTITVRGRLFAFDLNASTLERRSLAFDAVARPELRDRLAASLLTKGDYSRDVGWDGERRQLGSSKKDDSWRDLFTAGSRASVQRVREPLMELLDDVSTRTAISQARAVDALDAICADWCAEREARQYFDWRYYFVRYAGARSSVGEGFYHGRYDADGGGFSYGELRLLHGSSYTAYFTDALLMAAWFEGKLEASVEKPSWWHRYDPGMTLKKSRVEIRCIDEGFEVITRNDEDPIEQSVKSVLAGLSSTSGNRVLAKQTDHGGTRIDAEDRVQLCLGLVKALIAAEL